MYKLQQSVTRTCLPIPEIKTPLIFSLERRSLSVLLLRNDRELWGWVDRGLLRCWGLSRLSVAWLITEAKSKRIAGGNKDTSMSAVSSAEGPIRQMDVYWQAGDRKRETRRDEGEDGERERERERERKCLEVAHLGTGCNVSRPGGHHSPALSRVLFKAKQISGAECHHKDTQASSPPISVQGFKSPFLLPSPANPSSSFLYTASHPHSTPDYHIEGRHWATDLRSPHFRPSTIYWH